MKYQAEVFQSLGRVNLIYLYYPTKQDMADDFDHYTNSYQIYSKDLKNCQESLSTSDVINWKQHLQIQSM